MKKIFDEVMTLTMIVYNSFFDKLLFFIVQFQNAKLEFENELVKASEGGAIKYSIVRPTAFFKSVSGKSLANFFTLFVVLCVIYAPSSFHLRLVF